MSNWHELSEQEREACLRVLQSLADDPSPIAGDERMKALIAKIHKSGKKSERQADRVQRQNADRELRHGTAMAIRDLRGEALASAPEDDPRTEAGTLHRPSVCYVCKESFARLHPLYHQLCPECAVTNAGRRDQRADLRGRIALLTGGRIKIGYQTALRMLRDGARVIVTTRFPNDARRRFAEEADFHEWGDYLQVCALDLRNLPAVEGFAQELCETEPHLDILINNAAQTVKRPLSFYRHLLEGEGEASVLLEALPGYPGPLTEVALAAGPGNGPAALPPGPYDRYFPAGRLDADGQQVDLRPENSWSLRLHEVSTWEALEVHLVNAVAPFVLCRELKPLLLRSPHARRFVVNVSAMEGQFGRVAKTERHPHTNMAKAALNMLTRTSAADFGRDGIYMNSVDTGWITDEHPHERKLRHQQERGFFTPLDVIDGMARVYDPIVRGLVEPQEPIYGQFLKDYAPFPW